MTSFSKVINLADLKGNSLNSLALSHGDVRSSLQVGPIGFVVTGHCWSLPVSTSRKSETA